MFFQISQKLFLDGENSTQSEFIQQNLEPENLIPEEAGQKPEQNLEPTKDPVKFIPEAAEQNPKQIQRNLEPTKEHVDLIPESADQKSESIQNINLEPKNESVNIISEAAEQKTDQNVPQIDSHVVTDAVLASKVNHPLRPQRNTEQ